MELSGFELMILIYFGSLRT